MKKLFLVANWKAHKNSSQAYLWMSEFLSNDFASWVHVVSSSEPVQKMVIVCPPTTLLAPLHTLLSSAPVSIPLKLGAQDVSAFPEGAYTGEESAAMLKEFVDYVIIGHSERREGAGETDEVLREKVYAAQRQQLEPIYCVQGPDTFIPDLVRVVAYEPIQAIGSGKPESPEEANEVAKQIKETQDMPYVLYGGSVTSDNIYEFTSQPYLDGVLVGSASLDPHEFARIIQRA